MKQVRIEPSTASLVYRKAHILWWIWWNFFTHKPNIDIKDVAAASSRAKEDSHRSKPYFLSKPAYEDKVICFYAYKPGLRAARESRSHLAPGGTSLPAQRQCHAQPATKVARNRPCSIFLLAPQKRSFIGVLRDCRVDWRATLWFFSTPTRTFFFSVFHE